MLLSMLPVLNGEKNTVEFSFSFIPKEEECISGFFPDIEFCGPVQASGNVRNMAGYMVLTETISFTYRTACARCAEPVTRELSLTFEKDVAGGNVSEDNDDYIFIKDKKLDVLSPAIEELMLSLPSKTLCREDCRGLCPKCGADLNKGSCDCKETEGDPRFAVLKTLLK